MGLFTTAPLYDLGYGAKIRQRSISAEQTRLSFNNKPWVLGLSASHNGAACLLHANRIVAAVQEERLVGNISPVQFENRTMRA